jgi:hypothetical protein
MVDDKSPNLLTNPLFRYGVAASSALAVLVVAALFLDGTARLAAGGIAVLELLVTPMVLRRAGEQAAAEG